MANYHEMDRDALTAEKAALEPAPTRLIWQWTC